LGEGERSIEYGILESRVLAFEEKGCIRAMVS
jgi:hypothetical protein